MLQDKLPACPFLTVQHRCSLLLDFCSSNSGLLLGTEIPGLEPNGGCLSFCGFQHLQLGQSSTGQCPRPNRPFCFPVQCYLDSGTGVGPVILFSSCQMQPCVIAVTMQYLTHFALSLQQKCLCQKPSNIRLTAYRAVMVQGGFMSIWERLAKKLPNVHTRDQLLSRRWPHIATEYKRLRLAKQECNGVCHANVYVQKCEISHSYMKLECCLNDVAF